LHVLLLFLFFFRSCFHLYLPSFPSRRSSDLFFRVEVEGVDLEELVQHLFVAVAQRAQQHADRQLAAAVDAGEQRVLRVELEVQRAEEHTSELQSRENLVCRLLLVKKKKTRKK